MTAEEVADSWSAFCPTCGQEQDFASKAEVDAADGRWLDQLHIVDLSAIAEYAETTRGTVASWRNRHSDFPRPLATLAIGPIWRWSDIVRWLSASKKKIAGARTCARCRHAAMLHGRSRPFCDACDCAGFDR